MHRFARFGRTLIVTATSLVLLACGSSDERDLPVLEITAAPAVSPTGFTDAPLAFRLTVSTSLNSNFLVTLDDGQGHAFEIFFDTPNRGRVGNDYDLTLLGLRPGRTYTVTVTARTEDLIEALAASNLTITTPALPADFPVITLLESMPDQIEPGYTLLNTRRKDGSAAYNVIVDDEGEVVWYTQPSGPARTARVATGNLLVINETDGQISEINMRGEVESQAFSGLTEDVFLAFHSAQSSAGITGSAPVDVAEFHDTVDGFTSTNSYFASTRNATTPVMDFPLDEGINAGATGTVQVQDEPIVEFAILDGAVAETYKLLDFLEPTRIGYDGTDVLPGGGANWADINDVILADGIASLIVSLRNQDAVVKFRRLKNADGSVTLDYILGPHDNWGTDFDDFLLNEPTDGSPFEWQYHQSSVQLVSEIGAAENLLIFDNGNRRASPFTGNAPVDATVNESRAVEYIVDQTDTTNLTITQDWEWGAGESIYSPIAGDADRLANGNTLITFGGICTEGGIPSDNVDICDSSARIIEIMTEESAADPPVVTNTKVFDLLVESGAMSTGYIVDRSQRISSLYPTTATTLTVQ